MEPATMVPALKIQFSGNKSTVASFPIKEEGGDDVFIQFRRPAEPTDTNPNGSVKVCAFSEINDGELRTTISISKEAAEVLMVLLTEILLSCYEQKPSEN